MSFSIGIVGLPNVGKSTLFRALTKKQVPAENFPFCTIDPNVGVVAVPDERLATLAAISKSEKIIPTTIEFIDIAGLVAGAHKGEGLGNQFLAHIREVDAIAHVVRDFINEDIVHVGNRIDPRADEEIVMMELIMADLATVEKKIREATKASRGNPLLSKSLSRVCRGKGQGVVMRGGGSALGAWQKIKAILDSGKPARVIELSDEEKATIKDAPLLTSKPILKVLNVSEDELDSRTRFREGMLYRGNDRNNPPLPEGGIRGGGSGDDKKGPRENEIIISAKIEAELSELDETDAKTMLTELGLNQSGLDKLISAFYHLLNLITFFTSGPKETRAWTLTKGTKAPQAAGKIHTDFERGFIRAEVISYQDFVACNGEAGAREKGLLCLEGKDYIVQDGDVCHFRFSV